MKNWLALGLALSLFSAANVNAEVVGSGDSFRLYFDLTKSTSDLKRKAIFPTIYFANSNPVDINEGWTYQVFDLSGNPLSASQNFTATSDNVRVSEFGFAEFNEPIGNIAGYYEFTNIVGSFAIVDEAPPYVSVLFTNDQWEIHESTNHFKLRGRLELTKANASVPDAPRLSVMTSGETLFLSSNQNVSSTGSLLTFAPYPSADPINTLDLANIRHISGSLPVGSAFYVALQNYNSSGLSAYSNVENFTIVNQGAGLDEKSFPYPVKGILAPDVWPNHFGDNPDLIPMNQYLDDLVSTGANTVKIIFTPGVMANCTNNDFDPTITVGSQVEDVESFIRLIQSRGLKTALGPFFIVDGIVVGDSSGCSRPTPSDPVVWFSNYREKVLETAELAQNNNVDYFLMFQDEVQALLLNLDLTDEWIQLARDVKSRFGGTLTGLIGSKGDLYQFPTGIPSEIIDELDIVGVAPFPRYTEKNDPTLDELISSYYHTANDINVIGFLESIHKIYGKPVMITDRASHSFDGANKDESVIFNESIQLQIDEQEQADLFEAFFVNISSQKWDWFEGVLFSSMHRIPESLYNQTARHLGQYGEVFFGKLAEDTVRDWFDGSK